jgi:hypothetical protein
LPPKGNCERGLPLLHLALVDVANFEYFVNRCFAFDRVREAKGMIDVVL